MERLLESFVHIPPPPPPLLSFPRSCALALSTHSISTRSAGLSSATRRTATTLFANPPVYIYTYSTTWLLKSSSSSYLTPPVGAVRSDGESLLLDLPVGLRRASEGTNALTNSLGVNICFGGAEGLVNEFGVSRSRRGDMRERRARTNSLYSVRELRRTSRPWWLSRAGGGD